MLDFWCKVCYNIIVPRGKDKKREVKKMSLTNYLGIIEENYNKIVQSNNTTSRKRYARTILTVMELAPEVKKYWNYNENEFLWEDRFSKVGNPKTANYIISHGVVYDSMTNLRNAPSHSGLYLLGQTSFNPYTDVKQYWIKVGTSNDINKRMTSGYTTCCPCTVLLDTSYSDREYDCHRILKAKSLGRCQQNAEWFLVDRETYLEICDKKFDYFGL